jgi:glycosyltransferase involved in cell wall biosynthesis
MARGHDVLVLAGKKWPGGEGRWKLSRFCHDGIEVLALEVNPASVRWEETIGENSPAQREGLSEALDEARPDIVHLNGFKPALTALCMEKGLPFVVTAHHPGVVCPAGLRLNERGEICKVVARAEVCAPCCCKQRTRSRWFGAALAALPGGVTRIAAKASGLNGWLGKPMRAVAYPAAIRESLKRKALVWEQAPLWIAPSKAMAGFLRLQGIPDSRIRHIPHGMEPVTRVPPVLSGGGPVRFGYLGGASRVKGLHILVEAASHMDASTPFELHLFAKAAKPWEEAYLEQVRRIRVDSAKVVWHDPVPHERIAEAYAAFDILVVPSNWLEVFGLVVLEAFTADRPVIVSDAGALPELVRDGVDGLIVPHGDSSALASAMVRLAADSTQVAAMSSAIRPVRTVADHVENLLTAYASLAAARPGMVRIGHTG